MFYGHLINYYYSSCNFCPALILVDMENSHYAVENLIVCSVTVSQNMIFVLLSFSFFSLPL